MIKLTKKKGVGKSWACVFSDWEISEKKQTAPPTFHQFTGKPHFRTCEFLKKPISQGRHSSKKDPLHSCELNIPSERARTSFSFLPPPTHTHTRVTKKRPSTEPLSSLTINRLSSSSSMWELVKIKRSCREATAAC